MINVLLVDDQRLIRDGLRSLLEQSSVIRIVGIAENGQVAIEQVKALAPDVVLMDIHMPVMSGIAATQVITQHFPKTKVLILSTDEEDTYLVNALKAGAQGYLLKHSAVEEIVDAIQVIHAGHSQVGPGLLEKIMAKMSAPADTSVLVETSVPIAAVSPLELELTHLLQCFEAIDVANFARRILAEPTLDEMMNRVKAQLEQEPDNLTALYLMGVWSHHQVELLPALDYLRLGLRQGLQQKATADALLLFCRAAMAIDPEEVFAWLYQADNLWGDDEISLSLLSEVENVLGVESFAYQVLRTRWQIRSLITATDHVAAIDSTIEQLQRGFRQLPKDSELFQSPVANRSTVSNSNLA